MFSPLDIHFAGFIEELSGGDFPEAALAAALVSQRTGRGHVCLDLREMAGSPLMPGTDAGATVSCPPLADWVEGLRRLPTFGNPGENAPLILDSKGRLYLSRYFDYEQRLARFIRTAASEILLSPGPEALKEKLDRFFPTAPDQAVDWQKVAALTAAVRRLAVITGGPGTGKTTTVARILALLIELSREKTLRIALVAPTGKAAARLEEAIGHAADRLNCSDTVRDAIPRKASTIHRLLGTLSGSPYFVHGADNPLSLDVLIVDEASMVDLALMTKLTDALPAHARLILLGDKDQLASVEAGAVLGDICDRGEGCGLSSSFGEFLRKVLGPMDCPIGGARPGLHDCIVELRRSYRFSESSGIGRLSEAIRNSRTDEAMEVLGDSRHADLQWRETPPPPSLSDRMGPVIQEGLRDYFQSKGIRQLFERLASFRLIAALRRGPYGVEGLNGMVERIFEAKGVVRRGESYAGRPIMITANDYNLRLYNGDMGICLPAGWPESSNLPREEPELRATFLDAGGTVREFPMSRLPAYETAYATTVHKSQGSEFDTVHFILPDHDSPVLTRELLYTGITRARKRVILWGSAEILQLAISRRIQRSSGLRDAIWAP
jgi:exodeoxyribonuclease V alpha subunit